MDGINKFFIGVEEALRIPGYIPIVSSITGFVRMVAHGVLQGFLGSFIFIVSIFVGVVLQIFGLKKGAAAWLKMAPFGVNHVLQARLNVGRGSVEMIPVIGNIAVYFYDKGMKRKQLIPYPKIPNGKSKKR